MFNSFFLKLFHFLIYSHWCEIFGLLYILIQVLMNFITHFNLLSNDVYKQVLYNVKMTEKKINDLLSVGKQSILSWLIVLTAGYPVRADRDFKPWLFCQFYFKLNNVTCCRINALDDKNVL